MQKMLTCTPQPSEVWKTHSNVEVLWSSLRRLAGATIFDIVETECDIVYDESLESKVYSIAQCTAPQTVRASVLLVVGGWAGGLAVMLPWFWRVCRP